MERYFEIGKIASTHGIKGALKIFPTTDDPGRFQLLGEVTLEWRGGRETRDVEKVGFHKQFVLLKLKGLDDINMAEAYKGGRIIIPEKDALPLGEDEYYRRDLLGLLVYTLEGELLGELTDIIATGANDVYSVKGESGELLIPAIKQCVKNIDIKNKKMTVCLLRGMRE